MKNIAVALVSILVLSCSALPISAEEHEHDKKTERTITVQGQGKVSAVPDIVTLSVEVKQEGTTLDPVLVLVRKQMTQVLEAVKNQGIEGKEVNTDLFQVRPKYEQDKRGNPHPSGYVVANRVSVKVRDLKKTGKVLTAVLDAGATNVTGPDFEMDNPQAVERLALAAATKDAQLKARTVTEAAGVQLGEILTINPQNLSWPMPPRPMMMMRAMAMPAGDAQEPIAAGEQTLTGYVTVTYSIR